MQIHCTVLELMERSIIVFVDPDKILLKTFKFVLVLWILVNELLELELKLCEVGRASVHVFLRLQQEYLLLLVVGFDLLG